MEEKRLDIPYYIYLMLPWEQIREVRAGVMGKIKVIAQIRQITGYSLLESKNIVEDHFGWYFDPNDNLRAVESQLKKTNDTLMTVMGERNAYKYMVEKLFDTEDK